MEASGTAYPATFSLDPPERIANWRPLVQWLLAIPHLAVAAALSFVVRVVAVIAWFALVFSGRLPEGLSGLLCLSARYATRASTYAGFLYEEYPPFTFDTTGADPGDAPRVRVDFTPELENRNRMTVGFRIILAIPQILAVAVLGIGALLAYVGAFFAVLVTGRWPEGLRNFIVSVQRWSTRVQAYTLLLTDEYPPFTLA